MNGKGQYYLNIGITAVFGAYGVIGALYSEFLKPKYEWNVNLIVVDVVVLLGLLAAIVELFKAAYLHVKKDRELND